MRKILTYLCLTLSIIIIIIIQHKSRAADTSCGDWEAFKDEKCFKIIDDPLVNYSLAIDTCAHQDNSGSSLAVIGSKEEQDFLTNFLFNTQKVADNVWIGIKNSSSRFTTIDNLDLRYTNWSPGSPQNESEYSCVELIADKALAGKWTNVACARKNAVVCEKMQLWSVEQLQKTLLEERKIFHYTLDSLRKDISSIIENPVPPGFIYVQLPGQSEPKLVWPAVNWTDVSSSYAGLFFRVLGGSSEIYETEQMENDRHLEAVKFDQVVGGWNSQVAIPLNGEWSSSVYSGGYTDVNHYVHAFKLSTGEIRPRNKAFKIWKRIN